MSYRILGTFNDEPFAMGNVQVIADGLDRDCAKYVAQRLRETGTRCRVYRGAGDPTVEDGPDDVRRFIAEFYDSEAPEPEMWMSEQDEAEYHAANRVDEWIDEVRMR